MTYRHRSTPAKAIVVFDALYGDSGKGRTVAYFVHKHGSKWVVKYSGGAQCAHHVIDSDGRGFTFSQFGSGTLEGARTHLAGDFLLNPLNLGNEANKLAAIGVPDPMSLLTIDGDCPIITPYHRATNRLRELQRGDGRHGSCGQGIGETASDAATDPTMTLRASDLGDRAAVRYKLGYWQDRKRALFADDIANPGRCNSTAYAAELAKLIADPDVDLFDSYHRFADDVDIVPWSYLREIMTDPNPVVFEGAQGVLLDEWYGFHPYTTWSTTGPENAMRDLGDVDINRVDIDVVAVMRPYMVRHGAGPFPTESERLTEVLQDATNSTGNWQGPFRVGHFDPLVAKYALDCIEHVSGVHVDRLAFTNCDRLVGLSGFKSCVSYSGPDGRMHGLPLPIRGNLEAQQHLGGEMMRSTPSYRAVPTGSRTEVEQFIDHLSRSVFGKPVTLRTWGPALTDDATWTIPSTPEPIVV